MRLSDWSSDVCSSDLQRGAAAPEYREIAVAVILGPVAQAVAELAVVAHHAGAAQRRHHSVPEGRGAGDVRDGDGHVVEHGWTPGAADADHRLKAAVGPAQKMRAATAAAPQWSGRGPEPAGRRFVAS